VILSDLANPHPQLITDPEKNREFYEALGLEFRRDMDIVETERRSRPRRRPRIRDGAESFA